MADPDRARFEAWARTLEGNDRLSLARHIGPGYVYSTTQAAWLAWQEAARQQLAACHPFEPSLP